MAVPIGFDHDDVVVTPLFADVHALDATTHSRAPPTE
jgi:hypothetical protein